MDLIKKLTGKNPSEYEPVAKSLVDNSDTELFSKLVKQDDFLFEFIKENVAKRIQKACNHENYRNLLNFLKFYSPSYDTVIGEVLNTFGGDEIYDEMKKLYFEGTDSEKAYAAKYLLFHGINDEPLPEIRKNAKSEFLPLSINSIELLASVGDEVCKTEALEKLKSEDEFEQYEGVKFLVTYGAKDTADKIVDVMKKSALSESIASEIPYLLPLNELLSKDKESGLLVLCNIINAIPDIVSPSVVLDFGLYDIFYALIREPLTSSSAVFLALAKDKFSELCLNEEYLFDCDKNTKDEVKSIYDLLKNINSQKLKSYFYDELYDGSDFVFFVLDYVDEREVLESLLDSENQTLVLKVLTMLKEKGFLVDAHKKVALDNVQSEDIKLIVQSL